MRKRVLSAVLALVMLAAAMLPACGVSAASKTPVWDKYEKKGTHQVASFTFHLDTTGYDYKVWYPEDIKKMSRRPVLLYCNASGFNYENAPNTNAILEIAASRGYIVLNNTDKMTGNGVSMDAGFSELIRLNKTKSSPLYGKVNLKKVVLAGHSQGCNCALNMSDAKTYPNAKYYKAIFAASLPSQSVSKNGWYDPSLVKIPCLLIGGTSGFMESYTCPLEESLQANQAAINSDVVIGRFIGSDHASSFEKSYPYMFAWFDYYLNGSKTAAKAFYGRNPEMQKNPKWQDYNAKVCLTKAVITDIAADGTSVTPTWKTVKRASGYQVQTATDGRFRKGSKKVFVAGASQLTYTLTELTVGQKYYVRVRAYRTVAGKKYYGAWSVKKSVQL